MWGDVVSWTIYNRPSGMSILFHPVDEEQVRTSGNFVFLRAPVSQASAPRSAQLSCYLPWYTSVSSNKQRKMLGLPGGFCTTHNLLCADIEGMMFMARNNDVDPDM